MYKLGIILMVILFDLVVTCLAFLALMRSNSFSAG